MGAVGRVVAAAMLPLLLGGCLSLGTIDRRGTTVNESFGAMQNRAVLLNLVRASRSEPLYFLQVTQVTAQGSSDLKVAAPGFNLGPLPPKAAPPLTSFSNQANVLDNSTNTNLTVQPYNTQPFYQGMLQPLGLDDVDGLLKQGFPRELVFYLVIDKVRLTYKDNNQVQIIYNDPSTSTYGLFVSAVQSAMDHGLMTEVPNPDEMAGAADAAANSAPSGIATVTQPPGGSEKGPPPHAELCFERALASPAALADFQQLQGRMAINFCGGRHVKHLTVLLFGRETEVEVTTRSLYSMFTFLGRAMNSSNPPRLVDYGKTDYGTPDNPKAVGPEQTPEGLLVNVTGEDGFGGGCFAALGYAGRKYCVPNGDGSLVTRQVFNILTILVGLKQSPSALPFTGSLLIAP